MCIQVQNLRWIIQKIFCGYLTPRNCTRQLKTSSWSNKDTCIWISALLAPGRPITNARTSDRRKYVYIRGWKFPPQHCNHVSHPNIAAMFRATFTMKHKETIIATLVLVSCNIGCLIRSITYGYRCLQQSTAIRHTPKLLYTINWTKDIRDILSKIITNI